MGKSNLLGHLSDRSPFSDYLSENLPHITHGIHFNTGFLNVKNEVARVSAVPAYPPVSVVINNASYSQVPSSVLAISSTGTAGNKRALWRALARHIYGNIFSWALPALSKTGPVAAALTLNQ